MSFRFVAADLVDFSKLSPPDKELAERNTARIEEVKHRMGKKYLLAVPIKRRSL